MIPVSPSPVMNPEISVITATRNAIRDLPALAKSILRQPPELVEWIVIDSMSTDGTVEFLKGVEDPKLSWISETDTGIYDAWNKGIVRARGRWVIFLGAGDVLGADWLAACAAAPDVDLVYGDLEIRNESGELLTQVRPGPWDLVKPKMKLRMMLPHPGLAHNRRLFSQARFDTSFRIVGDFHFLAGADIQSAARLPITQAIMRLGGVSNHPDQVDLTFRENLRVIRQHGLSLPLADRARWLVKRFSAAVAPGLYFALQQVGWQFRRRL